MPRVKYLKTAAAKDASSNDALVRLIWGTKAARGMFDEDLCAFLGKSRASVTARKQDPGRFTIAELRSLCRGLNITPDELRGAIDFEGALT